MYFSFLSFRIFRDDLVVHSHASEPEADSRFQTKHKSRWWSWWECRIKSCLRGIRISGRGTHVCKNMLYIILYHHIYTYVDVHRTFWIPTGILCLDFRKRLVANTRHELMKSHQAGDPSVSPEKCCCWFDDLIRSVWWHTSQPRHPRNLPIETLQVDPFMFYQSSLASTSVHLSESLEIHQVGASKHLKQQQFVGWLKQFEYSSMSDTFCGCDFAKV